MARKAGFLAVLLLAVSAVSAQDEKKTPPAKVTITADLCCLKCDLKVGKECGVCLKLNEKTTLLLEGKAAKQLFKHRCDKKVVVVEGTVSGNKDKQLVLTGDKAAFHSPDDKNAPPKGIARIAGIPICGQCDLEICDECTLGVANGKHPILLDGKLATEYHAQQYKSVTTMGTLFVDQRGLVRLLATKVDVVERDE